MSAVATEPLVPLFDLRLTDADIAAVEDCLRSGWLTMGPRIAAFEDAFAEHLGVRHAVAVSSCTAALHLAYLAAGVEPGDEVIVPAITFVATAAAVRHCGATAVPADVVSAHDVGIDPADVARRITPRTRAVCAVHYAGYPAAVETLDALCREHGLALVEDAAHAPATRVAPDGPAAGTVGRAGAFSFFSNKVLSCGEGGLLATDDDAVASFARSRRSHAMTSGTWDRHRGHAPGYDVEDVGFNYRLDEPRAALLLARLGGLRADVEARRRFVRRYRALLSDVPRITVPYADEDVELSSCYVMPVLVDDAALRDPLRAWMLDRRRVQTAVLYPAIHTFAAYAGVRADGLRVSEDVAGRQLTLPLFPHMTADQQDRVVDALCDGICVLSR